MNYKKIASDIIQFVNCILIGGKQVSNLFLYVMIAMTVLGSFSLTVYATGTPDSKPPVIKSVSLNKTEVEVPDELEVEIDAEDDISGISHVYVNIDGPDDHTNADDFMIVAEQNDNGKWYAVISFDEYSKAGAHKIHSINIADNAGNVAKYWSFFENESENKFLFPAGCGDLEFEVINANSDTTPPVLKSINLNKTYVEAPGEIEIIAEAEDDLSGVDYMRVYFGNEYEAFYEAYLDIDDEDGKLHGTVTIDEFSLSRICPLYCVELHDKEGNGRSYFADADDGDDEAFPDSCKGIQFTVNGGTQPDTSDITPPILKNIALSKTLVEPPAEIEVIVNAEDDISGIGRLSVSFESGYSVSLNHRDGDTWRGTISINQYKPNAICKISSIVIEDIAGNMTTYYRSDNTLPEFCKDLKFEVKNSEVEDVDLDTITSSNLVEKITESSKNKIVVDYKNKSEVSEEIFDALKETDKTLTFVSDGIEWEFKGNQIVNPSKKIDLAVSINSLNNSSNDDIKNLEGIFAPESTYVFRFANNGVLPGKAKIRIKVDYVMRKYLGTNGIDIFYYDEVWNNLMPISLNLTVDSDDYIEFEIDHCSYYIATGKGNDKNSEIGNEGKSSSKKSRGSKKESFAEPTKNQKQFNLINQSLDEQIKIMNLTGDNFDGDRVVKIDGGNIVNSLPKSIIQKISDLKLVSCEFTYIYNGEKYITTIPASVTVDPQIEWYGPVYMMLSYPTNRVTTSGLVAVDNVSQLI